MTPGHELHDHRGAEVKLVLVVCITLDPEVLRKRRLCLSVVVHEELEDGFVQRPFGQRLEARKLEQLPFFDLIASGLQNPGNADALEVRRLRRGPKESARVRSSEHSGKGVNTPCAMLHASKCKQGMRSCCPPRN